jgi:putative transcriptional regulator
VPSKKTKPLADAELEAYEATRDLGAELLQSIQEMKAGKGQVVFSPAIEARKQTGLSQSQFAALIGVSVRTLQGWEQGRKQPAQRRERCWPLPAPTLRRSWPSRRNRPARSRPLRHSGAMRRLRRAVG